MIRRIPLSPVTFFSKTIGESAASVGPKKESRLKEKQNAILKIVCTKKETDPNKKSGLPCSTRDDKQDIVLRVQIR
jgi:hypothetical protein